MKSLLLKNEKKIYFKKDYLEHINKNVYRSESLIEGKIFKITKSHIYFDVGLKGFTKVTLKKFIKDYYKIINSTNFEGRGRKKSFSDFINSIKVENSFKFIIYELVSLQNSYFIDFEKTLDYITENKLFFKLSFLKNTNKTLKGYVLNSVNGGFSVDIGGLVAFLPNKELKSFLFKKRKDYLKNNNLFLNSSMNFKISSINFDRKNVVLSIPKNKKSKEKLKVRIKGLEPLRASSLESKPSMSTNSIISARKLRRRKNEN